MTRDAWKLGTTHYVYFNTHKADGTPATLSGTPVVKAYLNANTTEITTGVTLTADYDSRTGLNQVAVDTSSGYATGDLVALVITTGTVDSVSVIGTVVATAQIVAQSDDGIVSQGLLAAGGSTTAFTLPSGQRTNVQVGDILKPQGIPARIIATYNRGTGVGGVTTAFASDPSSLAYSVFGTAPADATLPVPADIRKVNTVTVLGDGSATPFHV